MSLRLSDQQAGLDSGLLLADQSEFVDQPAITGVLRFGDQDGGLSSGLLFTDQSLLFEGIGTVGTGTFSQSLTIVQSGIGKSFHQIPGTGQHRIDLEFSIDGIGVSKELVVKEPDLPPQAEPEEPPRREPRGRPYVLDDPLRDPSVPVNEYQSALGYLERNGVSRGVAQDLAVRLTEIARSQNVSVMSLLETTGNNKISTSKDIFQYLNNQRRTSTVNFGFDQGINNSRSTRSRIIKP